MNRPKIEFYYRDKPYYGRIKRKSKNFTGLLKNVQTVLDEFVAEALPDGGIDCSRSKYQQGGRGAGTFLDGCDPRYLRALIQVLYRTFDLTKNKEYLLIANKHCKHVIDKAEPGWPTWAYGDALSIGAMGLARNNQTTDLIKKMKQIFEWIHVRKYPKNILSYGYIPCGYPCLNAKDAGWSSDLAVTCIGLLRYYHISGDRRALEDLKGMVWYFTKEWEPNSLKDGIWTSGIWSSKLGTWLIGPLHYTGFESTDVYGDESGWGFSAMDGIEYFTGLYRITKNPVLKKHAVLSFRWVIENCQFEDGAIGLCGKDDKWVGFTGAAVTEYVMLNECNMLNEKEKQEFRKPVAKAFAWLIEHTLPGKWPDEGIVYVNKKTLPDPPVNIGWAKLMALIGLLDGLKLKEI